MTQAPTIPPLFNSAMKSLLRSPMHGMVSNNFMLISFTGRKSGATYTTPVSYSQHDEVVYVFTHAAWWKNLHSDPSVTLHIRGRQFQGLAELVAEDKQAVADGLRKHLLKAPGDARFYGVTFDDHRMPKVEEVEKAAQTVVMIRIRLC